MRVLILTGILMASAALIGCQAGPPPSASTRQPAVTQDPQPAPAGRQAEATPPAIAELPPISTDAPGNLDTGGRDANGPPVNLLQPPP
jgi:hypothetical protein